MAGASPMRIWSWQIFIHSFTKQILNTFYIPSVVLGAARNNPITVTPLESTLHVCLPDYTT